MKQNTLISKLFVLFIGFTLLIPACATATPQATSAPADAGEVVIYGWSGEWDIWFDTWGKEFKKETGITVKYLSGDGDAMFQRVQAEKDSPKADLYLSDTGEGFYMEGLGLLDKIDWSKVPNSKLIKPAFMHDSFLTWSTDLAVIGYNKDVNPNPPKSWKDLAGPSYKGKITINTPTSLRPAYIYMLLSKTYGEQEAWDILLGIFANAYKWTNSPGEIEQGLATGESLAAVATAGMVMQANQSLKAPVYTVIPSEGAIYDDNTILLIKNGPNRDNALKFIDFMLSDYYQNEVMNVHGISVAVNPNVKITNTDYEQIGLGGNSTDFIANNAYAIDWATWMAKEGDGTKLDSLIKEIDTKTKSSAP